MKKKKEQKIEPAAVLLEYLANAYTGFMLLVFPLVFHNAYFDILKTKRIVYLVVTGMVLAFACLLVLSLAIKKRISLREKLPKMVWSFGIFFILILLLSLLLVENPMQMFLGSTGRYLGVLVMVFCVLSVFFIGCFCTWNEGLMRCFLLGSFAVYVLQITDEWQLNVLGMHFPMLMMFHLSVQSEILTLMRRLTV